MRFGGLSSMTVLISLGALLLLIFVVFFTAFILKLLRQRKSKSLIYSKRLHRCWRQVDVGDFILVTIFEYK